MSDKKSSGKSFLQQIVARNEEVPAPQPVPPPVVPPPPAEPKPLTPVMAKQALSSKPGAKKPAKKPVLEVVEEAVEGIDKERITMYLDRELIHKLKLYAVNHRQRYSSVVNDALIKHLKD